MNILLVTQFYPPHPGGVEISTMNLARHLVRDYDSSVVVVTSRVPDDLPKYQRIDGVDVYRLKAMSPFWTLTKFTSHASSFVLNPSLPFFLPRIVKRHKIDVIHLQGQYFPLSVSSFVLNALVLKRPILVSFHGRLEHPTFERMFDRTVTAFLYRRAFRIVTVSKSLKRRLVYNGLPSSKIEVIHNGVDFSRFSRATIPNYLRKAFGFGPDDDIVLFVGRLEKIKGVDTLLRAVPLVLKEHPHARFVLVGKRRKGDAFDARILSRKLDVEKFVHFVEGVDPDEIPSAYNDAAVFCLPSLFEGFPVTVLEAMAAGVPVVATNIEGIPEAIVDGQHGFIVPPGDDVELARKISELLSLSREKRLEIGKRCQETVKKSFSWKLIAGEVETLYRRAVAAVKEQRLNYGI